MFGFEIGNQAELGWGQQLGGIQLPSLASTIENITKPPSSPEGASTEVGFDIYNRGSATATFFARALYTWDGTQADTSDVEIASDKFARRAFSFAMPNQDAVVTLQLFRYDLYGSPLKEAEVNVTVPLGTGQPPNGDEWVIPWEWILGGLIVACVGLVGYGIYTGTIKLPGPIQEAGRRLVGAGKVLRYGTTPERPMIMR